MQRSICQVVSGGEDQEEVSKDGEPTEPIVELAGRGVSEKSHKASLSPGLSNSRRVEFPKRFDHIHFCHDRVGKASSGSPVSSKIR